MSVFCHCFVVYQIYKYHLLKSTKKSFSSEFETLNYLMCGWIRRTEALCKKTTETPKVPKLLVMPQSWNLFKTCFEVLQLKFLTILVRFLLKPPAFSTFWMKHRFFLRNLETILLLTIYLFSKLWVLSIVSLSTDI